nr:hypothetical protein [Clostridia bacterium]
MNNEVNNSVDAVAEEPVAFVDTDTAALPTEEDIARARKAKLAAIWDKVTTGILILLMASPFLILGYIFHWFITK